MHVPIFTKARFSVTWNKLHEQAKTGATLGLLFFNADLGTVIMEPYVRDYGFRALAAKEGWGSIEVLWVPFFGFKHFMEADSMREVSKVL